MGAGAGFEVSAWLHSPAGIVATFAVYYLALIALIFLWLPRVTARRFAAEERENPEAFRRRQRRDRWLSLVGALGGLLGGGAGLIYGTP